MGVKQICVGLALAVAGGSLASCGGMESVTVPGVNPINETEVRRADGPAGTDSTRSEPRGFQFESGFLEFGEFDPYAIGDDVFNPCTEITEEEFGAAGFRQMEYDDGRNPFSQGIPSCDFVEAQSDIAGGFYGGVIDRAIAEERELILPEYVSKLIPELYAMRASNGIGGRCYVQIDTGRGAFGAHAGGPSGRVSLDRACGMAIDNAERLFLTHGLGVDQ